jgi:hypothetical protein
MGLLGGKGGVPLLPAKRLIFSGLSQPSELAA